MIFNINLDLLVCLRIISYFKYDDLYCNVKNIFYTIFTICYAQIGPKNKNAQNFLKFVTFDISGMPISILMSKMIFIKYLLPIGPKIKDAQYLLKPGTSNILSMVISIGYQN